MRDSGSPRLQCETRAFLFLPQVPCGGAAARAPKAISSKHEWYAFPVQEPKGVSDENQRQFCFLVVCSFAVGTGLSVPAKPFVELGGTYRVRLHSGGSPVARGLRAAVRHYREAWAAPAAGHGP